MTPDLFIDRFAEILELALSQSYSKLITNQIDQATMKRKNKELIIKCEIEEKYNFYGFNVKKEKFIKIFFANPNLQSKLKDILNSGMVLSYKFSVFEGHLNFLTNFAAKFNL